MFGGAPPHFKVFNVNCRQVYGHFPTGSGFAFASFLVFYFRNTQIYLCHTKSTPNASVPIHRQIVDQVARLIAGGNMAEEATRYRVFAGIETFLKKYSPAR